MFQLGDESAPDPATDPREQLALVLKRLAGFEEFIHVNCCSDEGGYFAFFTPDGFVGNCEFFDYRVNGCETEKEAIQRLTRVATDALSALHIIRKMVRSALGPDGPKFPCRIDEMEPREFEISQVAHAFSGALTFAAESADDVLGRQEADAPDLPSGT